MWYLVVLSLVSICAICYATRNLKGRQLAFYKRKTTKNAGYYLGIGFGLILFILCAFRAESVGNDTGMYLLVQEMLIQTGETSAGSYMEFGYQLFSLLVSFISSKPQAILVASAFLSYLLTFVFFRKYSSNFLIAVALFWALGFSISVNTIRHFLATAILFSAYIYTQKKKYLKAVICTGLAMCFHTTAVIMFVYIFLQRSRFNFKKVLIATGVLLGLSLQGSILVYLLCDMFPQYGIYLMGERVGSGWLGITFSLVKWLLIVYFYYIGCDMKSRSNSTKWLLTCCVWLIIMGYTMNLFERVSGFFQLLVIVPLINDFAVSKKSKRSWSLIGIGLVANIFFILQNILRPEWNYIYPYSFFGT